MRPNEWVAIITGITGAITGIASLSWNIYIKVSSGPKLRVQAWANMVVYPAPPGNPRLLRITVQNVGTTPTTLTNLGLHSYEYSEKAVKKFGGGFNAVVQEFYQQKYPFPVKLDVGGEWSGSMEQAGPVDELVMKDTLWVAVHHSFEKQPTVVRALLAPREAG